MRFLSALSAFVLAGALVACGGDNPPTISVTADKSTISSGEDVTFTVSVTDFELREGNPSGAGMHGHALTAANTGEHGHGGEAAHNDGAEEYFVNAGHYHVYLDTVDSNPIRQAWQETLTLTITASAGAHRVIFRLNDDAHRFFTPQITSHVDLTVQ